LNKYKYFIWTDGEDSEENVLFAQTLEQAIEFFNKLYMDIHTERRSNVKRIDLTEYEGEIILSYETHMGVLNGN
jgi:hypothetical protein